MKLSVCIVSFNAQEALEGCLSSLLENSEGPLEVIVADNASSDGSAELVKSRFPHVLLLENDENVGFSRASNLCWRRATSELILFLNSDTKVPPGAIDRLASILEARPDVGALGPCLRNEDGTLEMSFGAMMRLSSELWQKCLNYGYRLGVLRGYVEKRHARERDVDWVSGACLLTRRSLLERIEGFDENFFLYSEDVDLCARLRSLGCRVVYTPAVSVRHLKGRSVASNQERAFVEAQKSRLHFYRKHYGGMRLAALRVYMRVKLGLAYLLKPSSRSRYRRAMAILNTASK